MVYTAEIVLQTEGRFNAINITERVREIIRQSGISNGLACILFKHTTGAVLITEQETGILADMEDMFERIAPTAYPYKHHRRDVDYNGHAHMRSALMQVSITVPVVDGGLPFGRYQEIVVVDDQTEQEPRYIVVQVMGE